MTAPRIEYLFNRYLKRNCSLEEKEELMALLSDPAHEAVFRSMIQKLMEDTGSEMELPAGRAHLILSGILQSDKALAIPIESRRSLLHSPWMRVAAVVFLIVTAGLIFWLGQNRGDKKNEVARVPDQLPISPGTDKAMLTMADGTTVTLDSLQNGSLLQPKNANVQKQGTVLIYNTTTSATTSREFNTLSTPRGGQYRIVLSDGTGVWLNAASSLRYPTAFTGTSREVELSGEAYFEVAKDKRRPFNVKVNDVRVKVLGTHFNINAYSEEEAIKTSLLEGRVEVKKGSSVNSLKPGQQAILNRKDDHMNVVTADMDAVMAWKNGLFEFQGADIMTIMRQIARWYDVEVVSTDKIPSRRFEGKISRQAELSDVLQILELSDIKFKVEGKKIKFLSN